MDRNFLFINHRNNYTSEYKANQGENKHVYPFRSLLRKEPPCACLGSVRKRDLEVSLDHCHLEHSQITDGQFLKAGGDPI